MLINGEFLELLQATQVNNMLITLTADSDLMELSHAE